MQVLYVTDFSIELTNPTPSVDQATQDTLSLVGAWTSDKGDQVTPTDLLNNGERSLAPTHGAIAKHAQWVHLRTRSGSWVTRLDVTTTMTDSSQFSARATIGCLGNELSLRLGLAREFETQGLTPVAEPNIRQPRLLNNLVIHPNLRVLSHGQVVDGQYIQARRPEEAALVAETLQGQNRLPVLLVHSRTKEAHQAVHQAARGLIGLVRVVTLDLSTAHHLLALEPRARVPYAGGLVVWSDVEVPATTVGEEVVNAHDPDFLRRTLMQQIAPLSVLTRGSDELYRTVRRAERAERADVAAARTAAAVESGQQEAIVEALSQERDQALADFEDSFALLEKSETRANNLAREAARWKAKAEQLTIAQHYASVEVIDQPDGPTFDNVPQLETNHLESLDVICRHLTQAAEDRIHFTPAIKASWRKAKRYPTPEVMRAALISLAQVARDLYDGTDRTINHVDTWIRETYNLKVSLQDDQMPKPFRTFTYDGKQYDRTPHVKVNDGVPPHECGRIYFALDKTEERVIVDHIGLHY